MSTIRAVDLKKTKKIKLIKNVRCKILQVQPSVSSFGVTGSNLYFHLLPFHNRNSVNPCSTKSSQLLEGPKGLLRESWNSFTSLACSFGNRHFDVLNTCICFFPGSQGTEELRTTKSVACVIKHHPALGKLSQLSNKCLIDKSDGIASHFFLDSIALSQAKLH